MCGTADHRCGLEDNPFTTKFRSSDPVEAGFLVGVPPHDDAKLKWNLQIGIEDVHCDYWFLFPHESLSNAPQNTGTEVLDNDPPHVVHPFKWE